MHDLVDIFELCPKILVDMRYATENNFTHKKLYSQSKCYLRSLTAKKLIAVQNELENIGLGIKIFDAYRPCSVQKLLWQILPDENFLANPLIGSKHSRGAAVDLTLVDSNHEELKMPTAFDEFSTKAHRESPDWTFEESANSQLLENVMINHGFEPNIKEWWHYNDVDWAKYSLLDFSFEELTLGK